MKTYKVKSLINQVLKRHNGKFNAVADELQISAAYVRMLAKGDKRASYALRELIKRALKNS